MAVFDAFSTVRGLRRPTEAWFGPWIFFEKQPVFRMVRAGKLKSGAAKKVNRWSSSSTANARTNRHRREAMAKKGLIKNYEEHDPKGLSKDKLRLLDKMTGADTR